MHRGCGPHMMASTPTGQLGRSSGGVAASLLLILVLVSGSLCAGPICDMLGSNVSSGCAGMDVPKAPVHVSAVSVPACCQISQAPPARTTQKGALQRVERSLLQAAEVPAVAASFAAASFISHRVVLWPPVDRQSLLSVFLI